jgi:hypothetical protein
MEALDRLAAVAAESAYKEDAARQAGDEATRKNPRKEAKNRNGKPLRIVSGECRENAPPQRTIRPANQSANSSSAFSTSALCPATSTFVQVRAIFPAGSMRKVLRAESFLPGSDITEP